MAESPEFEEWYLADYGRVLAALVAVAAGVELGREATDEAFTRALERWDRVRLMDAPTGWVYTVGVNLLRRGHQRRTLERRAVGTALDVRPEAIVLIDDLIVTTGLRVLDRATLTVRPLPTNHPVRGFALERVGNDIWTTGTFALDGSSEVYPFTLPELMQWETTTTTTTTTVPE